MKTHPKITHCIWFDDNGEEAAKFYTSLFPSSEILNSSRYTKESAQASGKNEGEAMTVAFRLENLEFMALNGGPVFKPTPAISFFIHCENGDGIDHFWNHLSEGGKILMPLQEYPFSKRYGWLEDKFGVSWQIMHTDTAGDKRPKLVPSLMFTGDKSGSTSEAIELYTSLFNDSQLGLSVPYEETELKDKIMFADFRIAGQWFAAMDSPQEDDFDFTEGNSFIVHCEDQQEIDYFWQKLTEKGGNESQCGWLKDRCGISWQIIPKNLNRLLSSPAAVAAMMRMKKLNIEVLENAQ